MFSEGRKPLKTLHTRLPLLCQLKRQNGNVLHASRFLLYGISPTKNHGEISRKWDIILAQLLLVVELTSSFMPFLFAAVSYQWHLRFTGGCFARLLLEVLGSQPLALCVGFALQSLSDTMPPSLALLQWSLSGSLEL